MIYTAGSLFSGIGGIDLAFSLAGFDIRFQVEIEEFPRRVLAKHAPTYWPNAKRFEDVRHVGRGQLESVSVLFGGFPCQDISISGNRAGIAKHTRSGLWLEFARIIGEIRPHAVLLENADDIVSLGADVVLGDLAAMGYDALWLTLRASDVGAPHTRERWFCVAYANGIRRREPPRSSGGQTAFDLHGQLSPEKHGGGAVVSTLGASREAVGVAHSFDLQAQRAAWQQVSRSRRGTLQLERAGYRGGRRYGDQSRMGAHVDGVSGRLAGHRWPAGQGAFQYPYEPPRTLSQTTPHWEEKVRAIGNAVVPQLIFPIAQAIKAWLEASDAKSVRAA